MQIHKLEIEKLRVEFSQLTYSILMFKLSLNDKKKATQVEHLDKMKI